MSTETAGQSLFFTTTANSVSVHLSMFGRSDLSHHRACLSPSCGKVFDSRPLARGGKPRRGRPKEFCGDACKQRYYRQKAQLDEAINEAIAAVESSDLTVSLRAAWARALRLLFDVRAQYMTGPELLAYTLDDVDQIGKYGTRTTASLIRGWLKRPRPKPEVACRRCNGTGDDEFGRRYAFGNAIGAQADALAMAREAMHLLMQARPSVRSEPWFEGMLEWAARLRG